MCSRIAAAEADADIVVFDNELSPAQLRELQQAPGPQGRRSHAADSRHFRPPRPHARRQAAGRAGAVEVPVAAPGRQRARRLSRLGGGIGTRGPGETKLEADRRRIRVRMKVLPDDIDVVRRRRTQLRERRHKVDVPTVALVGYTNAGKTTLFNRLTKSDAEASDALFVTLDPLVRRVSPARSPGAAAVRHGRIHRSAAAHARRGLPRHARRDRRGGSGAARHRCLQSRTRTAHGCGDARA